MMADATRFLALAREASGRQERRHSQTKKTHTNWLRAYVIGITDEPREIFIVLSSMSAPASILERRVLALVVIFLCARIIRPEFGRHSAHAGMLARPEECPRRAARLSHCQVAVEESGATLESEKQCERLSYSEQKEGTLRPDATR